jgi:hypothetical protein
MQSPEHRRTPPQRDIPLPVAAVPGVGGNHQQDVFGGPVLVDFMWNGQLRRIPADLAAGFQQLPPAPAQPARGRRVSHGCA